MMNHLNKAQRAVAIWVIAGVVMLLVQVVLGGVTRLTGSGLSITEWNVLKKSGYLPPIGQAEWQAEFDKYKKTPQFLLVNSDFSLENFKFIYFWEWFHREWAKLIAVVFVVGFIFLLAKGYLKASVIKPLIILFLLGAMQGLIGWIMVLSGLTDDMIYVKPLKLALHFVFALVLICYAWWFSMQLWVDNRKLTEANSLRRYSWAILIVLFFQLIYGALMAGHKAGPAAATWPTINGSWWPEGIFNNGVNLVENRITIHFIHRALAYILFILTLLFTIKAFSRGGSGSYLRQTKLLPMLLITLQVLLGIFTVLTSTGIRPNHWVLFDWLAQFHQVIGLLFMMVMVWTLYITKVNRYSYR